MRRRSEPTIAGVRTVVMQSGPEASEEAIVFVHGNPGFSRDWEDLMERAGAICRCVAPDMPGFGRSDKPETFDYTVEGYARHLGALLTYLGVRRVHLVLHNFGGPWGLTWAVDNPSALVSLTLMNTGALPGYRWHLFARLWRTPVIGEAVMATTTRSGFHILIKRGNPHGLPKAFVDAMYDCLDPGTKRAVLRLYRATSNPGALAEKSGALFAIGPAPFSSSGAALTLISRRITRSDNAMSFRRRRSSFWNRAATGRTRTILSKSLRWRCHFGARPCQKPRRHDVCARRAAMVITFFKGFSC